MITSLDERAQVRTRRAARAAARRQVSWKFDAIDGMRGLTVLSVLLYHTNWSGSGLFGVDLFFALSGFLISLIMLRELENTGRLDVVGFYRRRFKRLVPALLITLAGVLAVAWFVASAKDLERYGETSLFAVLQIANWHQIWTGGSYWDHTGAIQPLAHMWSLSITEQFYLFWPGLFIACWWMTRRVIGWLIVALATLTVAAASISPLLFDGTNSDRLYLGTDSRAVAFIAGALAASVVYWVKTRRRSFAAPSRVGGALLTGISSTLLVIVLIASVSASSYHDDWIYEFGFALVAVVGSAFIATLCFPQNKLVKFFSFSVFRSLGKVSYTVFLLHLPIFWGLQLITPGIEPLTLFAVGTVLTWMLAAFVHYGITERMRTAPWKLTRGIPALVVSVAVVVAGSVLLPNQRLLQDQSTQTADADNSVVLTPGEEPVAVPEGRAGGRPVVLTVGDSLSNDIASALSDHGNDLFAINDGAAGGCGLLRSPQIRMEDGTAGDSKHCSDWRADWPNTLAAVQPDVIVMHTAWDALDQQIDGEWVKPGDVLYDTTYSQTLNEAAAIVEEFSPHSRIIVVNDRPTTGLIKDPDRTSAFDNLLTEFSGTKDNVDIADLASFLCETGECATTNDDGAALFLPDNVHFTPQGKSTIAPWLERQIVDSLT